MTPDQILDAKAKSFADAYMQTEDAKMDIATIRTIEPDMDIETVRNLVSFRAQWEYCELYESLVLGIPPVFTMTWAH